MPRLARAVFEGVPHHITQRGNLIEKTDAKGQRITYGYDVANRMTSINYPAAGTTPARTVNYTYDDNGNLTDYSDGTTTGSYIYDVLNRKTDESVSHTGGPTFSSAYTHLRNHLYRAMFIRRGS